MAWFRVQVLLKAVAPGGTIALRKAEYAVAAMDAMEAEDKAETIALDEARAESPSPWRWHQTRKTVKFSNSAQPLNDVTDGERLAFELLEFPSETALARYGD